MATFSAMIAITGATGLVGAHIMVQALKNGHRVRAVTRMGSSAVYAKKILHFYGLNAAQKSRLEWKPVDLNNPDDMEKALEGVDHFIHSAGLVNFDNRFIRVLLQANRDFTGNWVNAALVAGVRRMSYISSISADGTTVGTGKGKYEWGDLRWSHAYGFSKFQGELEVYRGREEGLGTRIYRPGVVLGPVDDKHPLFKAFRWFRQQLSLSFGGSIDLIDARDLARQVLEPDSHRNYDHPVACITTTRPVPQLIRKGQEVWRKKQGDIIIVGRIAGLIAAPIINFPSWILGRERPLPRNVVRSISEMNDHPHPGQAETYKNGFYSLRESLENCKDFLSRGRW